MKKVLIMGCTGSIGKSTLTVIRNMGEEFCVCGLVAHTNEKMLSDFCQEFACPGVLTQRDGVDAIGPLIEKTGPDMVVNAIAGSDGLEPTCIALKAGVDVALANKESVVMAWDLIKDLALTNRAHIIPVDSEHSAILSLLNKVGRDNVSRLVITASGGPFRTFTKDALASVSVEDALKHPVWRMGKKISIDSATLANKGLEVIEAARLFDFPTEKIDVVIHPQSYIHSLVQTSDGCLYAQASEPDMKLPILSALNYPDTKANYLEPFSLYDKTFTFFKPRLTDFPMLSYAYEAAKKGKSYTIAYNAANEVAVGAFVSGAIDFTTISRVVRTVLDKDWTQSVPTFEAVYTQNTLARKFTQDALAL